MCILVKKITKQIKYYINKNVDDTYLVQYIKDKTLILTTERWFKKSRQTYNLNEEILLK